MDKHAKYKPIPTFEKDRWPRIQTILDTKLYDNKRFSIICLQEVDRTAEDGKKIYGHLVKAGYKLCSPHAGGKLAAIIFYDPAVFVENDPQTKPPKNEAGSDHLPLFVRFEIAEEKARPPKIEKPRIRRPLASGLSQFASALEKLAEKIG